MPKRRIKSPPTYRSTDTDPPRKAGWQVRSSVADAVKRAVEQGAAESQNAFVERALIQELRAMRQRRVYEAYAAAMSDPDFTSDLEHIGRAFEAAASDGFQDPE